MCAQKYRNDDNDNFIIFFMRTYVSVTELVGWWWFDQPYNTMTCWGKRNTSFTSYTFLRIFWRVILLDWKIFSSSFHFSSFVFIFFFNFYFLQYENWMRLQVRNEKGKSWLLSVWIDLLNRRCKCYQHYY